MLRLTRLSAATGARRPSCSSAASTSPRTRAVRPALSPSLSQTQGVTLTHTRPPLVAQPRTRSEKTTASSRPKSPKSPRPGHPLSPHARRPRTSHHRRRLLRHSHPPSRQSERVDQPEEEQQDAVSARAVSPFLSHVPIPLSPVPAIFVASLTCARASRRVSREGCGSAAASRPSVRRRRSDLAGLSCPADRSKLPPVELN